MDKGKQYGMQFSLNATVLSFISVKKFPTRITVMTLKHPAWQGILSADFKFRSQKPIIPLMPYLIRLIFLKLQQIRRFDRLICHSLFSVHRTGLLTALVQE
jgi:hypothetical protein